ncbi:hypothetical protein IV417_10730 [Alphaproteobacteria bacterium KMM 3653]|uniref:Uncharacterized protein n=1 Tax=Harenicola maris TaxID=2841044 RepID=A0AAP2G828_9RHOB|nr:hypothetical protein [Harenicola maris]
MFTKSLRAGVIAMTLALPVTAKADLLVEITFEEQQTRAQGSRKQNGRCSSTIILRQLGPMLFQENGSSNCKIFKVGEVRGADGSAAAGVFAPNSGRVVTTCEYSGKSRVEKCSDGTQIRLPSSGKVDYRATYTKQSKYKLTNSSLTASRTLIRVLETAEGSNQKTESESSLKVAFKGNTCTLQAFKGVSAVRVARKKGSTTSWSGVKLSEERKLASPGTCRVISR